jgi:FixJ family two-component response regulator/glycine cleavage system H lipoate-binding protein
LKETHDLLVVEDEPVVLAAIRKIISLEHLSMDEAMNAEIALSKLKRNTYGLIISDLMLPKISGLDLIQIIKEDHPCVPLVVITGYATLEKALQSFKMGSFDFIPKPFDTEVFLGVIRRGLNFSKHMQDKGLDQRVFLHLPNESNKEPSAGYFYCLGCHAWIKFEENGTALVGVGETFPDMIKGLERMDIFVSNDEIVQGKCCAQFIDKNGLVNMLWAPLSGRVEATNPALEKDIQLINSAPYDQGWIFRITPSHFEEEAEFLTKCKRQT